MSQPAKNSPQKNSPTKKTRKSTTRRQFSALQKCQAVLSLWTESSTQSKICQDLQVNSLSLQRWEKLAIAAMLQALEPKKKASQTCSLSPRLEKLLEQETKQKLEDQAKQPAKESPQTQNKSIEQKVLEIELEMKKKDS